MKKIELRGKIGKGKFTLVDDSDFEWLNQFKWQSTQGYARRSWKENGKTKNLSMHREIIKPLIGEQVDHINGNKLDNRRENLRICASQGNNRNANTKRGISGYKGVHWYKRDQRWVAFLTIDDKHKYLGYFDDPKEAAKAYNEGAKKYFGEFAKLNQL